MRFRPWCVFLCLAGVVPTLAAQTLVAPTRVLEGTQFHVADVDGDGHDDLVFERFGDVGVVLGDGLGDFGPVIVSPAAPVLRLAVGDVDGDGVPDAVCSVDDAPQVAVLRGVGDGTFALLATLGLAQATEARRLILADVDGNGALDVIAHQLDTNRLNILLNAGGAFPDPPLQVITGNPTQALAAGDFDGDGNADLAYTLGNLFGDVSVRLGNGDGSFGTQIGLGSIQGLGVQVGDVTGDGRDDVVSYSIGDLLVWSWVEPTGFGAPQAWPAVGGGVDLIVDFDRDGRLDVIGGGAFAFVMLQTSGGALEASDDVFELVDGNVLEAAGDFDEDGGVDLLFDEQDLVGVLRGRGDATFEPTLGHAKPVVDLRAADLTGDGVPDLVSAHGEGESGQLRRGRWGGGFEPAEPVDLGPVAERLFVTDATGDGLLDVVAVGWVDGPPTIAVVAGHDDGTFDSPLLSPLAGIGSAWIRDVALGPLGGDARLDLAFLVDTDVPLEPETARLFVNDGTGAFSEAAAVDVSAQPRALALADMDGNGATDLLVRTFSRVEVFLDDGLGGFALAGSRGVGGASSLFLETADVDADGQQDAVFTEDLGVVSVLLGRGNGTFGPEIETDVESSAQSFSVADLDGDGALDLVVGNVLDAKALTLARGRGDGSFHPVETYPLGERTLRARVADFDGDGALDVAALVEDNNFTPGHGFVMLLPNAHGPWSNLGNSLAGPAGFSKLEGIGPLTGGSTITLRTRHGSPGAAVFLVLGLSEASVPFKGGVLVPQPDFVLSLPALDAEGELELSAAWPAGVPADTTAALQIWRPEPGAPSGFAATNAIGLRTP